MTAVLSPHRFHNRVGLYWALLLGCACGCQQTLETRYAAIRGDSVNGISAFIQLLRDTGHATTARRELPQVLPPDYRTIVVFDHSFKTFSAEAAKVLSDAMTEHENRTLVLALRDQDALIDYLRAVIAAEGLPARQRQRATELLKETIRDSEKATSVSRQATHPFSDALQIRDRPQTVHESRVRIVPGKSPAAAVPVRWVPRRRLQPTADARAVWTTEPQGEQLLTRTLQGNTEIYVLGSSLPLLNGGMVDAGNRRLAGQFVRLLPTEGRILVVGSARVSRPEGSGDLDADGNNPPSPWRLIFVQPIPWLLPQALLAMVFFCWSKAPIFGRPRSSSPEQVQDFGKHVSALASLLTKASGGSAYCGEQLKEWRRLDAKARGRRRSSQTARGI